MIVRNEKGERVCYLYSPIIKSRWLFGLDFRKSIIIISALFLSLIGLKWGLFMFILFLFLFGGVAIFIAFFKFEGLTLEQFIIINIKIKNRPKNFRHIQTGYVWSSPQIFKLSKEIYDEINKVIIR